MKMNIDVVSIEMGYGHMRAAYPIADALGVPVQLADEAPLADENDRKLWRWIRKAHAMLSRPTPWASFERPANAVMDWVTMIPSLHERADQSSPDVGTRALDQLIERGLGRGLVRSLEERGSALLTTFYAPAIIADRAGLGPVYCVVTDADVQRIWVATEPERSNIHYFAPSSRVVRRLRAYGVNDSNITLTGFPLPFELTGKHAREALRSQVARRIVRLDPEGTFRALHGSVIEGVLGPLPTEEVRSPVELVFAVGGAGAQVDMCEEFLPRFRDHVVRGRLKITLVAGTRADVAGKFVKHLRMARLSSQLGSGVMILYEPDFATYYRRFNALLAEADVLWTKPSELSFYAGLGIPLVLSHPVGTHERYNRRFLREQGAGLKQRRPEQLPGWFDEWYFDGYLAAAAWSAFLRIPSNGTEQILEGLKLASCAKQQRQNL
jgi:hypothetical protein